MTRLVEKYFPYAATIITAVAGTITMGGAITFNQLAKNIGDPSLAAALLLIAAILFAASCALYLFAYEIFRLQTARP